MDLGKKISNLFGSNRESANKQPPLNYMQQAAAQLDSVPRYTRGVLTFLDRKLAYTDALSTKFIISELFDTKIYEFTSSESVPYIIDCGANIGLSIIFFKQLYPESEIVAFEPDNTVFEILNENIRNFGLKDVVLHKNALWNSDTDLQFYSEGADSGRIQKLEGKTAEVVKAVRLSPFLERKVDFLKIDIEGAEIEVLEECAPNLGNVERLFVEYHSFVGKEQRLSKLIGILEAAGFRLNINSPGVASKQPFKRISQYNGMDLQLNIYAYRI